LRGLLHCCLQLYAGLTAKRNNNPILNSSRMDSVYPATLIVRAGVQPLVEPILANL
jgi:hypothetical protein